MHSCIHVQTGKIHFVEYNILQNSYGNIIFLNINNLK